MGYSSRTKTGESQTRDETYRAQNHGWLADGRSIDLTWKAMGRWGDMGRRCRWWWW